MLLIIPLAITVLLPSLDPLNISYPMIPGIILTTPDSSRYTGGLILLNFTPRILFKHYFPIGVVFTKEQIAQFLSECLTKSGLDIEFDGQEKGATKNAITIANQIMELKRTRKGNIEKLQVVGITPIINRNNNSLFKKVELKEIYSKFIFKRETLMDTEEINVIESPEIFNLDIEVQEENLEVILDRKSMIDRIKRLNNAIGNTDEKI
jgi:hypothetical protein